MIEHPSSTVMVAQGGRLGARWRVVDQGLLCGRCAAWSGVGRGGWSLRSSSLGGGWLCGFGRSLTQVVRPPLGAGRVPAQGLSDSMPYGRAVVDSGDGLPAPFSEGVRFDGAAQARSSGIWRYGLDLGLEQLAHSADGIDRSGPLRRCGMTARCVRGGLGADGLCRLSGLRHGSIWLGNSFAQAIAGRGSDPPDLDQPWVALTEEPRGGGETPSRRRSVVTG